tara:strand:- start:1434 stop:1955 length:522 start_codon:yes stop_codon:yes gene_type:complete
MSFNPLLAFHRKAESELMADGYGLRRRVEGRRSRTIWSKNPEGPWTPAGSHDHRWWSEIAEDFADEISEMKPTLEAEGRKDSAARWPSERVHRLYILEDGFAVIETEMVSGFTIEDSEWNFHRTVFDGDGSPKGNKAALWAAVSLFAYLSEGEGADKGAVWKTARQALTGGEA